MKQLHGALAEVHHAPDSAAGQASSCQQEQLRAAALDKHAELQARIADAEEQAAALSRYWFT